jgi:hypothetical protein
MTLGVLLVTLAAACGPVTVDTTKYLKTCAVPADCMVAYTGDVCGCSCAAVAISVSEQAKYSQAVTDAQKQCNPNDRRLCGACLAPQLTCNSGVCGLAVAP